MNIILLSGGSGKRLWPLSNEKCSKQFIPIFKNAEGQNESMLQRIYNRIKRINTGADITIAASSGQIQKIKEQIGEDVKLCIEPERRDTFPAIVLAVANLYYNQNKKSNESVVICPVDGCVEDDYFEALEKLNKIAQKSNSNITLMGINPTYPSEKYGYIIPKNNKNISKVSQFKEKPTEEEARKYIKMGALWNAGIFAFKIGYILELLHKMIDFKDYDELYQKYNCLKKTSFDYEVVENEENVEVMRFDGKWKDIGTWNTFTESIDSDIIGDNVIKEKCDNTHIINELGIPILCMGLKDIAVVTTENGIIVVNKEQSSYIKPHVDKILNKK